VVELEDTLDSKPNEHIVGVRLPPGAPFKRYNMTIQDFYHEHKEKIWLFACVCLVIFGLGWAVIGIYWASTGAFPWIVFINFCIWGLVASAILSGIMLILGD
jgi:hypothetical protein